MLLVSAFMLMLTACACAGLWELLAAFVFVAGFMLTLGVVSCVCTGFWGMLSAVASLLFLLF